MSRRCILVKDYRRTSATLKGVFLLFMMLPCATQADWFRNSEQIGLDYFTEGNFSAAAATFKDPYRQGVAHYRAQNFAASIKSFQAVKRSAVMQDARYNVANAHLQIGEYASAILAYDQVLEKDPEHLDARFNQGIARAMLIDTDPERLRQLDQEKEQQEKKKKEKQQQEQEEQKDKEQQESEAKNQDDGEEGKDKEEQSPSAESESDQPETENKSGDAASGASSKQQAAANDGKETGESGRDGEQQSPAGDMPDKNLDTRRGNEKKPSESLGKSSSAAAQQGQMPRLDATQNRSNRSDAVADFDQQHGPLKQDDQQDEDSTGKTPSKEIISPLMEQWLEQVEGDPAQLLRKQFMLEEQRVQRENGGQLVEIRPW